MSLRDLQTDYGIRDLYKLLEIGLVNAHNARVAAKLQAERQRMLQMQMQGG